MDLKEILIIGLSCTLIASMIYVIITDVPTTCSSSEVTGNEPVFDTWDKDNTDDFDGFWRNLKSIPFGFRDGIDADGANPFDQDLNTTDNATFNDINIDGITIMGSDGFRVRPAVDGNDWLNVTIGGDIYTQGTWTNDGNIRQAGSYWLYNTIGLLYPYVHMSSTGIEIYDGTIGENIVANFTNDGDANFIGNVTAHNVFIPNYLFAHTLTNISVDIAGTWYNITFNITESVKSGILHNYDDNTNDTFTITETGIYDLHGHLSFQDSAAAPNSNIVFRFTKNDEEIHGSLREYDLDKKDWDTLGSTTVFVSLSAGDEIKLQFTSDDTTVSLESDYTYGVHKDTAVIKIKRIA